MSFTRNDMTHLKNGYRFAGDQNVASLTEQKSVDFIHHFEMHLYPFDTQELKMEFVKAVDLVELEPAHLDHKPLTLMSYTVKQLTMCKANASNGQKAVVVTIILTRPIMSIMLTTLIPTTVLLVISYLSRLFREEYF